MGSSCTCFCWLLFFTIALTTAFLAGLGIIHAGFVLKFVSQYGVPMSTCHPGRTNLCIAYHCSGAVQNGSIAVKRTAPVLVGRNY